MMGKSFKHLFLSAFLLSALPAHAEPRGLDVWCKGPISALAGKASRHALQKLDMRSGEPILVLTNAGYVKVNDLDSSVALDAIAEVTGSSPGQGNLLSIHDALHQPLYFFYFSPSSGNAFYAEVNPRGIPEGTFLPPGGPEEMNGLFRRTDFKNIGRAQIFAHPERFEEDLRSGLFGNHGRALIGIAHLWMQKPPMEILRAVQFHDHVCPGVLSGYYISRFLATRFALGKGERYFIVAVPPYCKDDAFQAILNLTVGKRAMAAMLLSEEDKARLAPEARSAAGFFFRYDPIVKKGNGALIGFDWDRLNRDSGIDPGESFPLRKTLRIVQWMLDSREQYEKYVYFIRQFDLPPGGHPSDFGRVGINPFKNLGLWNQP
jgi:formylmethanofuran dehydrogenase subunit E-like metal-binding protein